MTILGYEKGTGRPVDIPTDRHIGVSGQTQRSGKTTTQEALIRRSGKRALAFITKRDESGFREAHEIPPYFEDSGDWQFVSAILEATIGERMKFQRSWIMEACRGANKLQDVSGHVRERLHGKPNPAFAAWPTISPKQRKGRKRPSEWLIRPASGLNSSVLTELEEYLKIVLPQLERLPYTNKLQLGPGLNVMDLREYSTEVQALVICSAMKWIYAHESGVVVIVPEAWKFIPQKRGSPVMFIAEKLIREGAASGNLLWIDSQDMAAVNKDLTRSIGVWILGVQKEHNEVERTLKSLPIGGLTRADIMTLGRGEFYAAWDNQVVKTYVQPFWISDAHAASIARGGPDDEKVESAERIWRDRKKEYDPQRICSRCGRPSSEHAHTGQLEMCPPQEANHEKNDSDPSGRFALAIDRGKGTNVSALGRASTTSGMDVEIPGTMEALPESPETEEDLTRIAFLEQQNEDLRREVLEQSRRIELLKRDLFALTGQKGTAVVESSANGYKVAVIPSPCPDDDASYAAFKRRLLADPGVIVVLNDVRPALSVRTERPTLEIDGSTLKGRLAKLIHEGFFRAARPAGDVLKECQRRGWLTANNRSNHLAPPLGDLTEMGFLTREDAGYQAVPGMKITQSER